MSQCDIQCPVRGVLSWCCPRSHLNILQRGRCQTELASICTQVVLAVKGCFLAPCIVILLSCNEPCREAFPKLNSPVPKLRRQQHCMMMWFIRSAKGMQEHSGGSV